MACIRGIMLRSRLSPPRYCNWISRWRTTDLKQPRDALNSGRTSPRRSTVSGAQIKAIANSLLTTSRLRSKACAIRRATSSLSSLRLTNRDRRSPRPRKRLNRSASPDRPFAALRGRPYERTVSARKGRSTCYRIITELLHSSCYLIIKLLRQARARLLRSAEQRRQYGRW